jgi:hypothetical protein
VTRYEKKTSTGELERFDGIRALTLEECDYKRLGHRGCTDWMEYKCYRRVEGCNKVRASRVGGRKMGWDKR